MSDQLDRLTAALKDRYAIERELGAGGMATVYLAEDLKHHRKVAVKVMRPELAAELGTERFLREIEIAAKLNHPNIVPLFDSGATDGFLYYVMPVVEGESLATRLSRDGTLPLPDALAVAREAANALDYAHRQGVVHRDIKPANILLHEGVALVADFGIARALRAAASTQLTQTGGAVGTPRYMSPEQAYGSEGLDARTDTYSLGCVLYEMLVGEPPPMFFDASTEVHTRLRDTPSQHRQRLDAVPTHIEHALAKALAKNASDRFGTAGEFARAISETAEHRIVPRQRHLARVAVPSLMAGGLILLLVMWLQKPPAGSSEMPTAVHRQVTFSGNAQSPAVSPDGNFLAYVEHLHTAGNLNDRLMVRDLAGGSPLEIIHDPEGTSPPKWSPDGTMLLFISMSRHGLFLSPRLGGELRLVLSLAGPIDGATARRNFDFGPDGDRVVLFETWPRRLEDPPPPLRIEIALDPSGVTADTTRVPVDAEYGDVDWSPATDWLALSDRGRLFITDPEGNIVDSIGPPHTEGFVHPGRWNADGTTLYFLEWAEGAHYLGMVSVNRETGRARESPTRMVSIFSDVSDFDVAPDGSGVYYFRRSFRSQLSLLDLSGPGQVGGLSRTQLTSGTAQYTRPSISPDGATVVYMRSAGDERRMYMMTLPDGTPQAIVATDGFMPVRSPDGRRVAFFQNGYPHVMEMPGGVPRQVGAVRFYSARVLAWSPNGSQLLYGTTGEERNHTIVDLVTGEERDLISEPSGNVGVALFSPDGNHVAFGWAPTDGPRGIWVVDLADHTRRFVTEVGTRPLTWSSDGRIFFLRIETNEIWSVPAGGGSGRLYATLPTECTKVSMSLDPARAVCEEARWDEDIWVAEFSDNGTRR